MIVTQNSAAQAHVTAAKRSLSSPPRQAVTQGKENSESFEEALLKPMSAPETHFETKTVSLEALVQDIEVTQGKENSESFEEALLKPMSVPETHFETKTVSLEALVQDIEANVVANLEIKGSVEDYAELISSDPTFVTPDGVVSQEIETLHEAAHKEVTDYTEVELSADRFDMTGVLGHAKAINMRPDKPLLSVVEIDSDYKKEKSTALGGGDHMSHVSILPGLNFGNGVSKSVILKAKPSRTLVASGVSKTNLERGETFKVTTVNEGDADIAMLNTAEDFGDGAEVSLRQAVKGQVKSVLNVLAQAQANSVFVALHTLEQGLKLIARVQNMTDAEKINLRESAIAMLSENGFSRVDIVIESRTGNRQSGQEET